MLRPATPLTIVLLISFVLLLLSTLSSPIIPSIPIATFQDIHFGVFGYCTPDNGCTGIRVGYTTDGLFEPQDNPNFNLPSDARRSLSSLLVVHPVAAFLNLVVLALAAAAHLHSPSHSARYLLGVLILLLPTLLVTLLAFLVDILLFVPHLAWGGWIVLGSTVLITAAGVITCAMRRTLVSRKARKKRIAENAEMSGENFYNRQAAQDAKLAATVPSFSPIESKSPMVNGGPGGDNLPSFATFEPGTRMADDREPLTQGPPSLARSISRDDGSSRMYGDVPRRSNSGPRDQFGNPMMPPSAGPVPPMPGRIPDDRRGPPPGPYNGPPPPRGGYGPRGRGGYPPRGRGGFGPRGPPPAGYGRGGYPPRGRGGYPPRGPPPPRGPDGAMMAGAMAGGAAGMMAGRAMGPPPPGYGPGPDSAGDPGPYPPPDRGNMMSPSVYSEGPGTMDGFGRRSGSLNRRPSNGSRGPSPAAGMRRASPPPAMPPLPNQPPAEMDGQGPAPQQEYVPIRAGWNNGPSATLPELPSSTSNVGGYGNAPPRPNRVNSGGSDIYFEDVDPRFAAEAEMPPPLNPGGLPNALAAGPQQQRRQNDESPDSLTIRPPPLTNSYEDLPGARSPAESETSNFTSVSQRGVNPNWRPGYGGDFNNFPPARRQSNTQARLLDANPDFQLPGVGPPGRRPPPPARGGYGMNPGRMPPPSAAMPPLTGVPMDDGLNSVPASSDGPYPRGAPMIPTEGVREI